MTATRQGSAAPLPRSLRPIRSVVAVLVLAAATGLGLWLAFSAARDDPAPELTLEEAVAEQLAEATPGPATAALVYQQIIPSIVVIQTERPSTDGPAELRESADSESPRGVTGFGTGVITNSAGDILTALHVVDDAETINIVFADGTRATAEVMNSDPENDIAVLSADGRPEVTVAAVMGAGSSLQVGDPVFAVGNPLGLTGSLSSGVVSGIGRNIPLEDETRLDGLIQFDAAVNPGNSGGPLLNEAGQVVGVVTALANPGDDASFVGIGFAVPIASAAGTAGAPAQ